MGGLEKSERFLKICILAKKHNLIETLFECRKEKNLAARIVDTCRSSNSKEYSKIFRRASPNVPCRFASGRQAPAVSKFFLFGRAIEGKKFFADRIRILAFFKFNSTIFSEKIVC